MVTLIAKYPKINKNNAHIHKTIAKIIAFDFKNSQKPLTTIVGQPA